MYQLRAVGYDGTLNIEHEDTLVSSSEGVRRTAKLLRDVVLTEAPDWSPAKIWTTEAVARPVYVDISMRVSAIPWSFFIVRIICPWGPYLTATLP
ncbi:hypothetical protein AB0O52_15750 [Arthrobacter sp. NPDC080073]|uniref:hypothetical protein n=1 Tax=Arthrobacter sp. NPDC080073 TaxID=3155919 RepID=UPI00342AF547